MSIRRYSVVWFLTPKRVLVFRTIKISLTIFWLNPSSSLRNKQVCTFRPLTSIRTILPDKGKMWFPIKSMQAEKIERFACCFLPSILSATISDSSVAVGIA